MKPRKEARTTTSARRMRELLALDDPRINEALLENPRRPKPLRKWIAKASSKPKASSKAQAPAATSITEPESSVQTAEAMGTEAMPTRAGDATPIENPAAAFDDQPIADPGAPLGILLAASAAQGVGPLTLADSIDRVLAAFKKEAAGAKQALGTGAPGEVVNAFFWAAPHAAASGHDKTRYTSDWLIFTEDQLGLGRKAGFRRKGQYAAIRREAISAIDIDLQLVPDPREKSAPPHAFLRMRFSLLDSPELVRYIYVDRHTSQAGAEIVHFIERLDRVKGLGWPIVEGDSWLAVAEADNLPADEAV